MRKFAVLLLILAGVWSGTMAREVYVLNNDWKFFFKEENSSDDARFVRLPHTWNYDALTGGGSYLQTMANYQRALYIPSEWSGRRLFLKFHGVQSVADVFINGEHVGEHRGGWTAFSFEITDYVRFGWDNTLLVVVDNSYGNDVLPTSTEANLYGGIYRDVELIVTSPTTVSPLYYGTDGVLVRQKSVTQEKVEGEVSVALDGPRDTQCSVTVNVVAPDGYVATSKTVKARPDGKLLNVPFTVENPELWSPSRPSLYRVDVSVGGDTVSVRTGFRHIEVTPEGKFTINGRRVYVRGVTLMHDRSQNASALSEKDYDSDLRLIRDMGANAVRSAIGPHDQYLYDECDRNGIVAWVETPFTQSPFLSDIAFFSTARFEENGREQMREIILQNYNHPSVVMWGVFSMLRGNTPKQLAYIRGLNALAKSLDPTRPTVACSNQDGEMNFITDLIVWQQSIGWMKGSVEDLKVWQRALSENWGHLSQAICYGEGGTIGQQNETFVKRGSSSSLHRIPESWQTRFHEGYSRLVDEELFWGVWINTMFDFGSARYRAGVQNSGLVAFDHAQTKDAYYLYRTLWNDRVPTLCITGKNREVRMREKQCIKVYSSRDVPVITLNGDTVAVRQLSRGVYYTDTLSMHGRNMIRATAGGQADSLMITIGNYLKRSNE